MKANARKIAAAALREAVGNAHHNVKAARQALATMREKRDAVRVMMETVLYFILQMNNKSISAWASAGYMGRPSITFYLNGIDGFKDPHLAQAIEFISVLCPDVKTEDYALSLNRDYMFKGPDFDVRIAAYVKTDSDTCKRIEVSRKTVQRDEIEYKLVCD